MGMNIVIDALIAHLNRHRKHLDDATITLIDQLMKGDQEPDGSQEEALYHAEWKLRDDLSAEKLDGGT